MPRWLERLSAILACVLPATLLHAALETPKEPSAPASLAGQMLIAAPNMGDPRFFHTVILMARHDKNGALGIVINRPLDERPLASLLEAAGDKDTAAAGTVRVFYGGPVEPGIGFVLHSHEYHRSETIDIDGEVSLTSSRGILRDLARNQGPKKLLIAFGYAGWRGGQLEGEMAMRAWFTAPDDAKLVFDTDRDKLWDEAMKRRTRDL